MRAMIFDTETNGLIDNRVLRLNQQPEIFEWYSCIVDLSTDETISELEFMCKPQRKLDKETIKITHVTDEMLADKPPFSHFSERVRAEIGAAENVIGHNINHDVECTEIEFQRLGQTILWPQKICTVEATIYMKGHRLKQSQLYAELFNGEVYADAHRARNDVQALRRICVELYRREML